MPLLRRIELASREFVGQAYLAIWGTLATGVNSGQGARNVIRNLIYIFS